MSQSSGNMPLVWFTSLAIGGAGVIASSAWRAPSDLSSEAVGLAIGTIALGAGILVSLSHLGRKSRAPLAVGGVGRSALSHEIVLAGATLAAALALLAMYWQGAFSAWPRIAAAATATLFLLSIGRVYHLGGQRTWRGATVLIPLTAGLVCGEVFLQAIGNASIREDSLAYWIVPIDALVFTVRWWTLARDTPPLVAPRVDGSRLHNLSAARLLIFDAVPLVLLDMHVAGPAIVAVALGLALDRWLFYALADQHTTEAEIARVEAMIERGSRIG
jgi:DMSO reductase anchor subunit